MTAAARIDVLVERLWEQQREVVEARVALVERFADLLAEGRADETARRHAADAAHKLAGVLGMYGRPEAGLLAHDLEVEVSASFPSRPCAGEPERVDRVVAAARRLRRELVP